MIAKRMKMLACMFGQVEREDRYEGGYDGEEVVFQHDDCG